MVKSRGQKGEEKNGIIFKALFDLLPRVTGLQQLPNENFTVVNLKSPKNHYLKSNCRSRRTYYNDMQIRSVL